MKMCELCGVEKATAHIRRTINGYTDEKYVCHSCAAKQGAGSFGNAMNMSDWIGNLFMTPVIKETDAVESCPTCKHTFSDIVKTGKVGCPDCYSTFYNRLSPSIQRIHGTTMHIARDSSKSIHEEAPADELELLKEQLSEAIEKQDYEKCVVLRDRIRELEAKEHE